MDTFIPFIMEIIDNYYSTTPNAENKDQMLVPQNPVDLSADRVSVDQKPQTMVDSSIL